MSLDLSLDELVEAGGAIRSRAGRSERKAEPYGKSKSHDWASLVESVREAQRNSFDWVKAWRDLCDSKGTGDYDPSRYGQQFLRSALAELGYSGTGDGEESWSKDSWRAKSGRPGSRGKDGPSKVSLRQGDSSATGGSGHAQLAESIKQWHRGSTRNADAWRAYCDERGDGSYDPARYSTGFLRRALSELAGGGEDAGSEAGHRAGSPLAEKVKEWQRASLVHTLAWRQYCNQSGDAGNYDPARYDAAFLRKAVATLNITSVPSAPTATGHASLVEEVKALQRASMDNTTAWREFCDEAGSGLYDPGRHDAAFLEAALERLSGRMPQRTSGSAARKQSWSGSAQSAGSSGPLTERVKLLQRSSMSATKSWREYCDKEGDGSYDPSYYEASFLKPWLAKMEAESW